ncbi:MAG: TIGR04168 family protein [Cyanobacteria bacterium J007]|nr:MAG: TIGR04168 family protein [Cyanobacteria bacterium J007]
MSDRQFEQQSLTVAVVGDVHEQWEREDAEALKALEVDLVLFVGDFGNECLRVVRAIADLDLPKALVFGNHDAWYSATHWGRKKCPYDRLTEDWVADQLEITDDFHVGYAHLDFPEYGLSVVGTRPFSWGGPEWKYAEFYRDRFGVNSMEESRDRILAAVRETSCDTIIFLGHNGPYGLGASPEDPCGRDWNPIGGDFGDPDFQEAIAATRQLGKTIPLVTFGHMHHNLRHTKQRQRRSTHVDATGTLYLNSACVPRVIVTETDVKRNFSLVSLENGVVTDARLVWLDRHFQAIAQQILYENPGKAMRQLA